MAIQAPAHSATTTSEALSHRIARPSPTAYVAPPLMNDQLLDTHIMPSGLPPNRQALFAILYNGYRRSSLEPCGCVSHKLGGIDREAKVIERITTSGMPLLKLEAGGYIRDMASRSAALKTASKYLLKALAALDYDVLNVGVTDMEMGKAFLEQSLGSKADRLVSANVVDPATSQPLFATHKILTVTLPSGETVKIGVTGVTRPRQGLARPDASKDYAIADPVAALKKIVPELRKQCDLVIVLAYVNREGLANDILSRLGADPGIDIAVAGEYLGSGSEVQNVGGVRVVSGGFEGRQVGLLVLEWRNGKIAQHFNKLVEIEQSIAPRPDISKIISDYLKELVKSTEAQTSSPVE
jgi:2',3'-cyclic-nucleotide 2'-phosphodiesterase (5'-nucleotidase family)